jgi:hypothetical protein
LIGHDQISDLTGGKENPLVFGAITLAALDQTRAKAMLAKAGKVYDALASIVSPAWLVDQTHPNIWFAEHWSTLYPSAHLVGIIRNPFSVVASMMKHSGVREWAVDWEKYPVPNPFLGVTSENEALYREMSLAERCTLRWISHYRRLQRLTGTMGEKLSLVAYEDLCREPRATLAQIADRLRIGSEFTLPEVDTAALTRGASMSLENVAAIGRLLAQANVEERWRQPLW